MALLLGVDSTACGTLNLLGRLACVYFHDPSSVPGQEVSVRSWLGTDTLSVLPHSIGQNKSQGLLRFMGKKFHLLMKERQNHTASGMATGENNWAHVLQSIYHRYHVYY